MEQSHTNFKLSCCRLIGGEVIKKPHVLVPVDDVVLIDTVDLSKYDRRLRIRTIDEEYVFNMSGSLAAMEDMLADFGFWRPDTKNLINMRYVDKVVHNMFAAEVVFKNTEIRGTVAKIKLNLLKEAFPEIPVLRGGLL